MNTPAVTIYHLLCEKGTPYAELGLVAPHWIEAQLIDHMPAHPILINRPLPQKGPFSKEDGELLIDAEGRRVAGAA